MNRFLWTPAIFFSTAYAQNHGRRMKLRADLQQFHIPRFSSLNHMLWFLFRILHRFFNVALFCWRPRISGLLMFPLFLLLPWSSFDNVHIASSSSVLLLHCFISIRKTYYPLMSVLLNINICSYQLLKPHFVWDAVLSEEYTQAKATLQ